jgi:UDP-glucose 4-epimerase
MSATSVLVTGAGGYLGSQVIAGLAAQRASGRLASVVALDVREVSLERRLPGVIYATADIRAPGLEALLREHAVDTVVHLASIVTPGQHSDRAFEYSVDVGGTQRVLDACLAARVGHLIVSSSGAAYGYHADNAPCLSEDDPIRGNQVFAYAWHKRLVEEMLARARQDHPALQQTIFRIGTILGVTVRNQITDLFDKPRLIGIRGADSPFVFIWDQDVVGAMLHAINTGKAGIYNVAGDGAMTLREIAQRLDKPVLALPAWLLCGALGVLKPLGLTQYGPEQIDFLRYRPVLSNQRLKHEFGFVPSMTSAQVFDFYLKARREQQARST